MALLLLALLVGTLLFLFYYELIWKKFEHANGRSLVWVARDFFLGSNPQAALTSSPWQDWKYRTLVELHRKDRLHPAEAANLAGVPLPDMERYLDELAAEGKVQSAGDAERGVFYKTVRNEVANPPLSRSSGATAAGQALRQGSGQAARGFE